MKCKSLFWVLVFMLLNSRVVCAEEEVVDDTQHMSQIQEEVNENLESVEEEKNFEERIAGLKSICIFVAEK